MAEPQSIRNQPYADFPRQAYTIFSDDFCHEKLLTVKPTIKTIRSVLKLKQTVTQKNGKYSFADETKLWFNLPKHGSLYAKIKSGDYVKLHYDDGVRTFQGKQVYFYGGVNSNRSLNLQSIKLGVGHDSEHCHSDNRVKVTAEKGGNHNFYWYNRTVVNHGNFKFGIVSCLDICNKVLQKNNILLGYNFDANTQGFLRAEVDGFRNENANLRAPETIFDKVTLDLLRKFRNVNNLSTTTVGVELGYAIRERQLNNIQVVAQYQKVNKQVFKVAVSQRFDVSLLVKKPLSWWDNFATFAASANLSGLHEHKFAVKAGVEIAINL